MVKINRKSVLGKLSSPGRPNCMIKITRPVFRLSMLGVAGIGVAALAWSIFGRLPINISGNGVLISDDVLFGIYSEAQGVLAEITVSQGDTVTRGQVVATIVDGDARTAMQELEERIATVEAVTLTSKDDVTSVDTQNLLEIKSSFSTSNAALLQSQSTLNQYQEQLNTESGILNQLAEQLADAKRDYDDAIQSAPGVTDELLAACTNAEQAYQATAKQLETAKQRFQSADTAWYNAQAQVLSYEAAVAGARSDVQAAQAAYDIAVAQKNAQSAAQEALRAAEEDVVNCDPSSPDFPDLLDALARAQSNPDLTLTPNMDDITTYEMLNATLSSREGELATVRTACDASTEAYATAQAAYNQAVAESAAAEKAYLEAQEAYDAYQASVSLKISVYQDVLTKYSTQQSIVANLEQNVLSASAQVDYDSTQVVTLGDQFETTKASILGRLRAELEQAERTLNKTNITSSRDGVVAELPVSIGTMVEPGTEIVKLSGLYDSGADDNTVVICYIPLSSGEKVAEGMTVMVYPTTVNKQEYGHMEATVLFVDNYETSTAEMRNQVGDDLLVQSITQEGPVLAVICELHTDSSTASGYYWSSAKAKDILLAEGTPVSVDVVIDRQAPVTMLFSLLKEKLSDEGGME